MRLFTFGCSMTAYHYPTWADIIGRGFETFQNWGRPGAGNNYILNAINRCNLVNRLTPEDTVVVLWSGLARIDYYQINEWSHLVNVYYDLDDKKMPYSCPDGYQWLSFAWMASAQHLLHNLGVRYRMFAWQLFDQDTEAYRLYQPVLEKITHAPVLSNPSPYPMHPQGKKTAEQYYQRCAGKDWPKLDQILDLSYRKMNLDDFVRCEVDQFARTLQEDRSNSHVYEEHDRHPGPIRHLEWAKRYLSEYHISQSTENWVSDTDHKVKNSMPYQFRSSLA